MGPAKKGDVAGTPHAGGYWQIVVDGRSYRAHRLAWFYVNGVWPKNGLDHTNGIKVDNRIANLREATQAENNQNRSLDARNKSGHVGVSCRKDTNKWYARIMINRKEIRIGYFDFIEDAITARAEAKRKYHTFNPQDRNTNES